MHVHESESIWESVKGEAWEGLQGKKGKGKNGVIIKNNHKSKKRKRKRNISNHTLNKYEVILEFKSMNATSLTLVSQMQHDRLFEPDNFGRKKNELTCSL